jgi:excinuclease ABC subunit A
VGTSTEIYDYLKLLYARIGKTYSPVSGEEVKKDTVSDVVNRIMGTPSGTRLLLISPVSINREKEVSTVIGILKQQGFSRLMVNQEIIRIDDFKESSRQDIWLVVDRIVVQEGEDFQNRVADSVQTAFYEGKGACAIEWVDSKKRELFSNKFEKDGMTFLEPNVHFFSFNNPYGACESCEGYGNIIGIDDDLVIPNTGLSVYDDAILPWKSDSFRNYKEDLVLNAYKFDFPIHKPVYELSEEQYELLWKGNKYFHGLDDFFQHLEEKSYKIQYRVMLSRYRGKTKCTTCQGKRLRKEAGYVKVGGKSIMELVDLPIDEVLLFFRDLKLSDSDNAIAKRLLIEIRNRLEFLMDVGLNYLTLNRNSNTLSGGESQRINLATSLGSSLVGSMYILDEPSIGLHSRDTERLIQVLIKLRDLGNTVIVVEHDEDIIKVADHIIDIGPEAGSFGGELVAEGTFQEILNADTLTANYLKGAMKIEIPEKRRTSKRFIEIIGARANNLKNIDVRLPLNSLAMITGVSGSGKSTLIRNILFPALQKAIHQYGEKPGQFSEIKGDISSLQNIEFIDQNPIGRSSRSNPVTYIKAYDDIRGLYADQKLSTTRGYKAKFFSFNVDGGRCDTCKGEGEVTIEMQFMADVHLECETCKGKRFKKEVLEIVYEGKNINDILETTVDEAIQFFSTHGQKRIVSKLKPLQDVGLGYVQLGQASSTLSGGEAQRIKLASFLVKGHSKEKTLFIFDEPSTGLHFHDIKKLLKSFNALIERGHSIIVIEHNLDLIKCADYILDLGPEGGKKGGQIVAQGIPEDLVKNERSFTARYLKEKLMN